MNATFESEILQEINQSVTAKQIIDKIRVLRDSPDRWEMITTLKSYALDISRLSESDQLSVISYAKNQLHLKQDDTKSLKIEIGKHSHNNILNTYDMQLDFNRDGRILPSDKNLITIFKTDPEICHCFCKNTFSNEIDVPRGGQWMIQDSDFPRNLENSDLNQLKQYLINKYSVEYKINQIDEGVKTLAIINNYNPLMDYLNPLAWDGTPRLETWLIDHCGVIDNAYTRWVGKLVLTAAVARAYVPGIKYDHVVVLAGEQGTLKSTLVETLASEPFFNSITLSDNDRDTTQKMLGVWIAELPEGMPFKRREINDLKNFVSSKKNKERFAYEHIMETYKRRSIFIMTINPTSLGYLPDETGNRRYLPVRINGRINITAIRKLRDQLFAEAKHLFQHHFPLYIDQNNDEILQGLADEHAIAETHDEWEAPIIQWLISPHVPSLPAQIPCITIWIDCLKGRLTDYIQQNHGSRIGRILRKLGAKYTSKRENDVVVKGYHITELIGKLRQNAVENVMKQAESVEEWQE